LKSFEKCHLMSMEISKTASAYWASVIHLEPRDQTLGVEEMKCGTIAVRDGLTRAEHVK